MGSPNPRLCIVIPGSGVVGSPNGVVPQPVLNGSNCVQVAVAVGVEFVQVVGII